MLYYNFKNYEEFTAYFGIVKHGNGAKNRKNKILLAYLKDKNLLHQCIKTGDFFLLHISSMADLKSKITEAIIESGEEKPNLPYPLELNRKIYHSNQYRLDEYGGVCEDNDTKAIRYINHETGRVYKMKAGKFYRSVILETAYGRNLPKQVLTYLCEEFTADWQVYSMGHLPKFKLHVNKNFSDIYDSDICEGDFHSCMMDKGFDSFYENSVNASAAYLTNKEGKIIARCIIYNEVTDQDGKVWRLAERQYSTDCSDILKKALVDSLIKEGHIDGYKQVGAGCGDSQAFLDITGASLSDKKFRISCDLGWNDRLSYQDSFKFYDMNRRIATNYGEGDIQLDVTEGSLDGGEYDEYHGRYADSTTYVYYHGEGILCDSNDLEDFVYIDSEGEYHHKDDVKTCEECGETVLHVSAYYSELTGEYYCCEHCMETAEQIYKEANWHYSAYDSEYYENESEVTIFMEYQGNYRYKETTISQETLDEKVDKGDFYKFGDVVYDAISQDTNLPYGMILIAA
ncbi:hypothetical protein [Culturomica massiliensis]|jgi:hypothetical protein|uniref:hypothetical protein n=1 Tax=Culturomica massiliensis TaxID=1841857 RepID=UPI000E5598C1|nr:MULTISPECIES: hypothetical protein [Odoribacteraceae]RHV89622.1 hypothetical protein DXA95_15850 [Odoribacter sp. OF09-27XD]